MTHLSIRELKFPFLAIINKNLTTCLLFIHLENKRIKHSITQIKFTFNNSKTSVLNIKKEKKNILEPLDNLMLYITYRFEELHEYILLGQQCYHHLIEQSETHNSDLDIYIYMKQTKDN